MLVLLAILMVTAPVLEFEEQINLPSGSKSVQVQDVKKITVFINEKREVKVNKNKYDIKDFADSFILYAKSKDRNTPIHIRADKSLVYDDIIFVLRTIKEAGFFKVSLITDG
jgi:biopolymer transport protein ExbD